MTQVYKFMERDWNTIPVVSYFKDPHALAWIPEYKARKITQRVKGVNMRAARTIVKKKMEKHHVRVNPENLQETMNFLADQDLNGDDFVYVSNGTFFFRDPEVMTAVKVFYS